MLESQCEAEPLLVGSDNFEILRGISKALITSEKFGFGFDQKIGSAQLWLHNPHSDIKYYTVYITFPVGAVY